MPPLRWVLLVLGAIAVAVPVAVAAPPKAKPHSHVACGTRGLRFGAYADPAPYQGGAAPVDELQAQLRRRIGITLWYEAWGVGTVPRFDWLNAATAHSRLPLLTWEPWDHARGTNQPKYRLEQIAAGAFDDFILRSARQLARYKKRVFLRPMHEMNGNWYPWGATNGNTPADYVAAWRHMYAIFARAGARNVCFVWSPDVNGAPGSVFEQYYPGKRYVQVLALDGYNWGGSGWRSFDTIFKTAYRRVARLGKQPIWITETGSAPDGGDKAAWVCDMWRSTRHYTRLHALIWFNKVMQRDWRANSSPAVVAAFAPGAARNCSH